MANGELSTKIEGVEKLDASTLLKVISSGDCSGLNDKQKVAYYVGRCEAAGLDPRARPFEYVNLGGKLVLYANKAASDQLAGNHGIKTEILSQTTESGIRTVHVRATSRDGKVTEDIGCVSLGTSTGDQLGNAMMKAVTKAKRRAILSLCGLGLPDETEVETIPAGSAPPSLPLPRRRSEAAKDGVKEEPKVIDAPVALVEPPVAEGEEPLVVPDRDSVEIVKREDGTIQGWFKVKDVKYAEGSNSKGPWKKWAAVIDYEGQEITPSTFSETMGDKLNSLKGGDADLTFKANGKYWNLVAAETCAF